MKRIAYILTTIAVVLSSCKKDKSLDKGCHRSELLSIGNPGNTIIPLHSLNFWIYSDSLWDNGNFESEKNTLIRIEKVYDLDGMIAVEHSSILPLLTIKEDTLFSTEITPGQYSPNCYEMYFPMFFSTEDSVQVDSFPSNKYVYKSTTPIVTPVGVFSENIVYNEEGLFEIITNAQVGILKISFYIYNGVNMQKRRTLTLKDYELN